MGVVTGFSAPPGLPAGEARAAEALLARAWGRPAVVRAADAIWDRGHVFRLRLDADRSAVLKRQPDDAHRGGWPSFGVELAALEFLNSMPVPVAPRLLGADPGA